MLKLRDAAKKWNGGMVVITTTAAGGPTNAATTWADASANRNYIHRLPMFRSASPSDQPRDRTRICDDMGA
jgi:hypothetical protein